MSGRLFDYDPLTGTVQWFHWQDDVKGKEMVLQTVQPTEEIVEGNKQHYNNAPDRWGDGQLVARIPISVWGQLQKQGITKDKKAFRRWLNDPDQKVFRLRPGKL